MAATPKTCSASNCNDLAVCKGYCGKHYMRVKRNGHTEKVKIATVAPCSVSNCSNMAHSKGYCHSHYQRAKRYGDPLGGKTGRGALASWLKQHANYTGDDCLFWPYSITRKGYAACIRVNGKQTSASRYMCSLVSGPPPTVSHQAAHSCGNGHLGCLNPKHLRWATPKDNTLDKNEHGTMGRGESHGCAKLTESDVRFIRRAPQSGYSLAKRYGVSKTTISQIRLRKTWRHI